MPFFGFKKSFFEPPETQPFMELWISPPVLSRNRTSNFQCKGSTISLTKNIYITPKIYTTKIWTNLRKICEKSENSKKHIEIIKIVKTNYY